MKDCFILQMVIKEYSIMYVSKLIDCFPEEEYVDYCGEVDGEGAVPEELFEEFGHDGSSEKGVLLHVFLDGFVGQIQGDGLE